MKLRCPKELTLQGLAGQGKGVALCRRSGGDLAMHAAAMPEVWATACSGKSYNKSGLILSSNLPCEPFLPLWGEVFILRMSASMSTIHEQCPVGNC